MSSLRSVACPIAIFLWIGFVCAISFMEAWLKFRAELVTYEIGISIGRLIFSALNKVEWVLAIIALCTIHGPFLWYVKPLLYISILILAIQTFWLLPALNVRAAQIIASEPLEPSYIHFVYIVSEVVKVVCLFSFGVLLLSRR